MRQILIVEDDVVCYESIVRHIDTNFNTLYPLVKISRVETLQGMREHILNKQIDLLILDLILPDSRSGVDTIEKVLDLLPDTPIIVCTGGLDDESASMISVGNLDFISKSDLTGLSALITGNFQSINFNEKQLIPIKRQLAEIIRQLLTQRKLSLSLELLHKKVLGSDSSDDESVVSSVKKLNSQITKLNERLVTLEAMKNWIIAALASSALAIIQALLSGIF